MTLLRPSEYRGAVASGSPGYNPFENPSVPLASVGLDNVYGMSNNDAGEQVTPSSASGVGTFYRCLFLLSSVVAACPIEVYRFRDQEPQENRLFDPSNDAMTYTPFELWQLVMVYRLIWGNGFVFKKRNGYDQIIDLKPLYPGNVEIKPGPDGHKIFLVKSLNDDGTVDEMAKPQAFTDWDIMHIPNMGMDGLGGLPVVKLMSQTLGTALAADRLAARFYSRGTQLGGILKVKAPLKSQTQAEGIKSRWMARNAGVANAGDVAVLDAETDFQSVTIPPDQLQFLESRRWQTTEIARWFGVPPHLVGDVEKSTSWGSGIEQQNLGLNTYTLSGHVTPIEQRATRELLVRGQYAEFNMDRLMRGSTTERYTAYHQALSAGWITANEVRKKEKMKPITGAEMDLDKPFPPAGLTELNPPDGSQPGQAPEPA